jgi:hypothetical protein
LGIDGSVGIFDLKKSQMRALLLAIAIKETENFNIIFSILNISKTATTVNFSRKEKGKKRLSILVPMVTITLIQHFQCGDSLQFLHCLIWRILYKKKSSPPEE